MKWRLSAFDWNNATTKRELRAAQNRKLTLRLNTPNTLGFSVPGDHPDALLIKELVTDIIVSADGVDVTRLRCGPSMDSVAESGYGVTFNALDYRGVLKRRRLNPSDTLFYPPTTDEATIVWGMITAIQARTNGNYGITQGVGFPTTGDLRQATFKAGAFVGDEIDRLANVQGGFDWDFTAALVLNLYNPQRGANNSVVLDYGKAVSSFTRARTAAQFANDLMVTGDQNTVPAFASSAGIATDPAGRWDGVESFPTISDPQTIIDRAPFSVAQRSVTSATLTVNLAPGYWRGPSHIGLGDTVKWKAKRGRLNDYVDLRVLEIGIDIGDDGGEQVSMSLGAI